MMDIVLIKHFAHSADFDSLPVQITVPEKIRSIIKEEIESQVMNH